MKRPSFISVDQLRVGGLILVAMLILGFAVYKLGQAANLFSRRYELIVYLPSANGLREGGTVTLAGQLVGTVKKIEFLPVDYDTTRNLRVQLRIERALSEQIRKDSEARLRTMGLLGDKVLDISPGTPRYPVLRAGDTIHVASSLDYEAVLVKAAGAVDDVVALTHDLRSITSGLARGQGTMGQLLTNRAMYDQLTGAMARANSLFAGLQNPNGTFGRLLNDPTLYNRVTGAVTSLDSMLVAMNSSQGTIGKLMRDSTLYDNLAGIAQGADSLMRMLSNSDGFVGKLLTDQTLYDQLNKLTTDLGQVLADVRRDPRRYTKGLICVLNCK
ncbi:MAG TPA: MlaD family protein [Gemmatimonadaceae bacterium]|nr:MlaD family protein [Gemmatimonadaceae bacterium]